MNVASSLVARAIALLEESGTHIAPDNLASVLDGRGCVVAPTVLSYDGDGDAVLIEFARSGLTVRVPDRSVSKQATWWSIHDPRSARQKNDLRRFLEAFAALEEQGFVTIAGAGKTRGAAWERVEELQKTEDAPALFWLTDAANFDELGELRSDLALSWRGDANTVVRALVAAGLHAAEPADEGPIVVRTRYAPEPTLTYIELAPLIATVEEASAYRWPRATKPVGPTSPLTILHRGSWSQVDSTIITPPRVEQLAVRADDAEVAIAWDGGSVRLAVIDLRLGLPIKAFEPETPWGGVCGGACFLPDGRLVFSWRDYMNPSPPPGDSSSLATLYVWDPEADTERRVARFIGSHVAHESLSSVDRDGAVVALAIPGVSSSKDGIHWLSKRSAVALYDVRQGFTERAMIPLPSNGRKVSISPDAGLIAAGDAGANIDCFRTTDSTLLWSADPFDAFDAHRGTALYAISFDPLSNVLCALTLRQFSSSPPPGKKKWSTRVERRLRCYDALSGTAVHRELEAATDGLTAFAIHPKGDVIAVGDDAGSVRLLAYPSGVEIAKEQLFPGSKRLPHGGTTALAWSPSGSMLVAGDCHGEVVVAQYQTT